jgi:hypothetical protein
MQFAGDIIAKAQDWPGAQELAERLRKTIPPELLAGEKDENGQPIQAQPQIPPQLQQMIQEGQQTIQQLTQENQSMKADKQTEMTKLQIDMYNAETQRMKVQNETNDRKMNTMVKANQDKNAQDARQRLSDSAGE